MSIVVGSKAKAHLKEMGCNCAGDALDGLESVLNWYLDEAVAQAKANGRKTVRGYDFMVGSGKGAGCLVASKCKEHIKSNDCNTAGDALDSLDAAAMWCLEQAAGRAKANGRKTVRKNDFIAAN